MAVNGGLSGYWSSCISIINFTSTPCIDCKTRKYHSYLEARISGYAFLNDKRYPCSVTWDEYNEQHIQEPWSQLPYYENLSTLTCVNKTCLCLTFRIQWMILNTPAMPWVWNLETSSEKLCFTCGVWLICASQKFYRWSGPQVFWTSFKSIKTSIDALFHFHCQQWASSGQLDHLLANWTGRM